jgi:hypothetical protein
LLSPELLLSYYEIGLKPVPLDELSKAPLIQWGEIYSNSNFWSLDKLREYSNKFHNIATTFGQTHLKDAQNIPLYLNCLDIDSDEVLKRVTSTLEGEWKSKTFVTKTQKDCGYHVYWFEHIVHDNPILTEDNKKGFEFEVKCGKSLCTLPPSRHRDNPLFHYENVGQSDKIMIIDGLYDKLVNELLIDCLRKRKKVSKPKKYNALQELSYNSTSSSARVNNAVKFDAYLTNSTNTTNKIALTDAQIKESTHYLLPYYKEGTRDKFAFGFSGLAYKEGVNVESASAVLSNICNRVSDPDKDTRLDTLHRTYRKGLKNGTDAITGKTKLKKVIAHISNCDNKTSEIVVQNLIKSWSRNYDNQQQYEKQNEKPSEDKNNTKSNSRGDNGTPDATLASGDDSDGNSGNDNESCLATESLQNELAAAGIHDYVEYVISVANKTVKLDDSLVRGIFYTGCSTWTFDPLNLGIIAPTSEGKTYSVLQVLQYFPKRDVKFIGSMSPKVIIRQDSILVDPDTLKPIQSDIDTLKQQIVKEKNKKRKDELEEQLQTLLANARPLIDLRGKLYVFLEPPIPETWNIIKPIMSHDNFVMEHPYVESNTFQGIHVRSIITLGFPAFIFCTAKDESKWEQWDEIASRSLVMSPNMSTKKYRAANILNARQLGLPTAIQEILIRSEKEVELARKCILYLKDSITEDANLEPSSSENNREFHYNNPVWIPYTEILGNTLPADKGTEMRINRRLMLLLRIISLAKSDLRYQVIFNNQTLTVADVVDLSESLYIMQNSTGLPPYKVKFFNEIFYPVCKEKLEEKLKEYNLQENIVIEVGATREKKENKLKQNYRDPPPTISSVRLTANEISEYYNRINPKSPINSDNLRKRYLNELTYAGFIEAMDVRDGNTKKVYLPIVSPSYEESITNQFHSQETEESKEIPQFFTNHKINVPSSFIPLGSDWLNIEVLKLWKCGIDIGNDRPLLDSSKFVNHNNDTNDESNNNYNSSAIPSVSSATPTTTTITAIIQFLDKEIVNISIRDTSCKNNERTKLTMTQFVQSYNTTIDSLSRHFSRPIFSNFHNKIFGELQYLEISSIHSKTNSGNCQNS